MVKRLSSKIVKTRKKHFCFACLRWFQRDVKMINEVVVSEDGIFSLYQCFTCQELFKTSDIFFNDYENCYPEGCVKEILKKDQTPEQLLIELKQKFKTLED